MLIIASGFPNNYGGVANELVRSRAGGWFPTTDDFRATAIHSGGTGQAATFKELLKIIGKEGERSITDLSLVGHANTQTFALSGRVVGDGMIFGPEGMITKQSIVDNLDTIKAVRNRFNTQTANARITLYACDAGADPRLLDELSKAFQVGVRGFQHEIFWCFTPIGKGAAKRGGTFYDANGLRIHPSCASFSADIRTWIPENKSFVGVQIDL